MARPIQRLVVGVFLGLQLTVLAAGAAEPEPARQAGQDAATFARRDLLSAKEWSRQLLQVPELDITGGSAGGAAMLLASLRTEASFIRAGTGKVAEHKYDGRRPDPNAPILLGFQQKVWQDLELSDSLEKETQIAEKEAAALAETATAARRHGLVSVPGRQGKMTPPKITSLGDASRVLPLGAKEPLKLIPALVQMLQTEAEPSRLLLHQLLQQSADPTATIALARRALFDPSPALREEAVKSLAARPPEQYRGVLLAGLRHPLPAVADHAAEALVALQDNRALPRLKELVSEPDPRAPAPRSKDDATPLVREVVRVNHLRNCVLCHAISPAGKETAVGVVPIPDQPLPVAYYAGRSSENLLVRADVTYLRQDFSLVLPVERAAPWPEEQRFDFLVRTRKATAEEVEAAKKPAATYPQREAVLFAIQELQRLKELAAKSTPQSAE